MTRFFITRPIFASVLSIIIVLAGLAAAIQLPVAQYPPITPPTIRVTATFPGASAETLIKTVAAPIEENLSGIDGLLYFSSSADSSGNLTITVTFEIGTDIDMATFNVSNRLNIALPRLPDEVRREAGGLERLYAVHRDNGEQLALVANRKLAFILAREHDFAPVPVH